MFLGVKLQMRHNLCIYIYTHMYMYLRAGLDKIKKDARVIIPLFSHLKIKHVQHLKGEVWTK